MGCDESESTRDARGAACAAGAVAGSTAARAAVAGTAAAAHSIFRPLGLF